MIKSSMDLGCLDLGCLSVSDKKNGVGVADHLDFSSSSSKSSQNKSPRETSALRKIQSKRSSQRKTSPLGWFPRRKGDSYLNRKIKKLQEVGGMNQTLDETLGASNPHYCKILREKMAVREAAGKAMELRKAALIEASWCKVLRAARIPSLDAETLMENAERAAVEAFEAASAMGVIMHDSRNQYRIQSSGTHEGGSPTHTRTASFETAFDVDKEVAAAVKTAFTRLANCPSLTKAEFKDLLRKISENPGVRDSNNEITEMSSECDTESDSEFGILHKVDEEVSECEESSYIKMRQLKVKRRQSFGKFSREKLVDMMLERLQGLQEDQLSGLASIVAACGLNKALAEVGNQTTNIEPTVSDHGNSSSIDTRTRRGSSLRPFNDGKATSGKESEIPSLDKYLVKRMSKLEREVYEAKRATKNVSDKDSKVANDTVPEMENRKKTPLDPIPDLESLLVKKNVSGLEKEIQETIGNCGKMYENVKKPTESEVPSLDSCLVKHVSKLEKEVQEAKKRSKEDLETRNFKTEELGKENVDLNIKAEGQDESLVKSVQDYESLDKILVKHVPKLEKEKMRSKGEAGEETRPILTRRQARDKEMLEAWGGLGLGDSSLYQKVNKNKRKPETEKIETETPVLTRRQARDKEMLEAWGGLGLGDSNLYQTVNKNKRKPETEKIETETPVLTRRQARDKEMLEAWGGLGLGDSNLYQTVNKNKRKSETDKIETETPLLTRRQARDREMQEAWGGLDLGNSIRPSLSKLEREKAAWIKADEEERTQGR